MRELLKRGLNELGIINHSEGISGWHLNGDIEPWNRTEFPGLIDEIEAELAKPEIEPIGIFTGTFNGGIGSPLRIEVKCHGAMPEVGAKLYTSPPGTERRLSEALTTANQFRAERDELRAYQLEIDIEFEDGQSVRIDCYGSEVDMRRMKARVEFWRDLEVENQNLKARIDGGIRVMAHRVGIFHDWELKVDESYPQPNATLLLDEGATLS